LLADQPSKRERILWAAIGAAALHDDFTQVSEKFAGLRHHLIARCRIFRF
jgi:hypothetical protein